MVRSVALATVLNHEAAIFGLILQDAASWLVMMNDESAFVVRRWLGPVEQRTCPE